MAAYTKIADFTVTDATTDVVLTNFGTITKDDVIKLVVTAVSSVNNTFKIFPNSQLVDSQYKVQSMVLNTASRTGSRTTTNRFGYLTAGKTNHIESLIKLSEDNRFNILSQSHTSLDASFKIDYDYCVSSGVTFPNGITSFLFNGTQTNAIGAGTRFELYRLDAEKVADIVINRGDFIQTNYIFNNVNYPPNFTGLDIKNLNFTTADQFLLVSDIINGAVPASAPRLSLTVNDYNNLSSVNYNVRGTLVFDSTINNFGGNGNSDFMEVFFSTTDTQPSRALAFTFLDMSTPATNKNATFGQLHWNSLTIAKSFANDPVIREYIGVSPTPTGSSFPVPPNVNFPTVINTLNIRSHVRNSIAVGSRFILYKLK